MVNYAYGWIEEWYIYNLYIVTLWAFLPNSTMLKISLLKSQHTEALGHFLLCVRRIFCDTNCRFLRTGETLHWAPGTGRAISYRLVANISPQLEDQRGHAGGLRSLSRVGVLTPQELANAATGASSSRQPVKHLQAEPLLEQFWRWVEGRRFSNGTWALEGTRHKFIPAAL